jgi:hypothetical protein
MEAYDAILGYDWLSSHNPMMCHWDLKALEFQDKGQRVQLQGIQSAQLSLTSITPEQFVKMQSGNDIWALAVVQQPSPQQDIVSNLSLLKCWPNFKRCL